MQSFDFWKDCEEESIVQFDDSMNMVVPDSIGDGGEAANDADFIVDDSGDDIDASVEAIVDFRGVKSRLRTTSKKVIHDFDLNEPSVEERLMEAKYKGERDFDLNKLPIAEPAISLQHTRYLHLNELAVEDVVWVAEADSLHDATCHIEECKIIGLDCEWKPNYIKGSKPNKVSIMQIVADKMVFILDLIKLSEDVPDTLDNCLARILQSPRILKLGYNFQCDVKQLADSYGVLKCFKHYEMLLNIQNVFQKREGGLSGLAEKILGVGLNKTRRNSNWEQRPLTQNKNSMFVL